MTIPTHTIIGMLLMTLCFAGTTDAAEPPALPDWALGPFTRPPGAQPVIRPDPEAVFDCPMRKAPVHWESKHTFNPAAVVKDGKVYVLYRAEDDSSKGGIGSFTSRIGLAVSDDGIHFTAEPKPVLFPAEDDQKDHEWYGGCEDPRLAEGPDGTCYLTYTQYGRDYKGGVRLGLAKSSDLRSWTKLGSPFTGSKYADNHGIALKSAAIVHELKDGHLVAAKINGKYWMYFGEHAVNLASSDDMVHWVPVEDANGKPLKVLATRPGKLDSSLDEVGPQALLADKGIIVFYNASNAGGAQGDPTLPAGVYCGGQALFDAAEPAKLIARLDKPYIKPELDWEKTGQYVQGTTFTEGLVLFKGKWFLYYGSADTYVGVAICDPVAKPEPR